MVSSAGLSRSSRFIANDASLATSFRPKARRPPGWDLLCLLGSSLHASRGCRESSGKRRQAFRQLAKLHSGDHAEPVLSLSTRPPPKRPNRKSTPGPGHRSWSPYPPRISGRLYARRLSPLENLTQSVITTHRPALPSMKRYVESSTPCSSCDDDLNAQLLQVLMMMCRYLIIRDNHVNFLWRHNEGKALFAELR